MTINRRYLARAALAVLTIGILSYSRKTAAGLSAPSEDRHASAPFALLSYSRKTAAGLSAPPEERATHSSHKTPEQAAWIDPNAMPIDLDRGAAGLSRYLAAIRTRASILMVVAHPDDEDGGMLAYQTRGVGARGTLLTLNRGEGGQNAMSTDFYDAMGLERTQELLAAGRYYGVDQYWSSVIDYGFSKTREEALDKWGYDRVLSDVVRVVRMTRPLVITAVFAGAPTDGHGNHQVSGQMAQEAYLAAGDPTRFPEQFKEGLRPWTPLKVYARVPFFEVDKKKGIYDYATDKYVPVRFYDYVNKTWINEKPAENIGIAEGDCSPAAGLTFLQIGRQGLGKQKSQNGGITTPPPVFYSGAYHRYGSRIPTKEKEKSFYDGMDVSLQGIATLAAGNTAFLKSGLNEIAKLADAAAETYKPEHPANIAPRLADGLKATRSLIARVSESNLAEPGKSDVEYELRVKEKQFAQALALSLSVSFEAAVAPDKAPTGPFAAFAGPSPTFTIAVPGQKFAVQTRVVNESDETLNVESINVEPAYGASGEKPWQIQPEGSPTPALTGRNDVRLKFNVSVPEDATLTKPYFYRPNQEQPYYDLTDPRFRNLSLAPYPLFAMATLTYHGVDLELTKVVQSIQHTEGIGLESNPLVLGPAISVALSAEAGAVPLSSTSFSLSCTLHSNVKGAAKGVLRLALPKGWHSEPGDYSFALNSDGETDKVAFRITPQDIKPERYHIKAVAEYNGKSYEEGYRLIGYAGLRPYPYYRPASFDAVGVDVTTAPDLKVGFVAGTGDDVPQALQELGVTVRELTSSDIQAGELSNFDAIVLGVRAYSAHPELRSANSRLLSYVRNGGTLIVQYNLQEFDSPYPLTLGSNPAKVVDEGSAVQFVDPTNPLFAWPNKITPSDFKQWEEERGHGFIATYDPHYKPLVETHDPDQLPQLGGLLETHYGKGIYIYDAFALYRQLPAGVPGAYRILANLVSASKNPEWK